MQNLNTRDPQQSLNAGILRFRPNEPHFNHFKNVLNELLGNIDEADREKNQENHIRDFLLNAFYKDENAVNGKGDIDLVIHEGKTKTAKVSVLIETKRPSSGEMISVSNPNNKALRQAILYFMQERVKDGYSLKGLLGILNSKLFNWLYSTRFLDYEIKPTYLKISPLADVNDENFIKIVDEIFELKSAAKRRTSRKTGLTRWFMIYTN